MTMFCFQEYRSCVFTCPFHGCNDAQSIQMTTGVLLVTFCSAIAAKFVWI